MNPLLLSLSFLLVINSYSQTNDTITKYDLSEVVVTSSRNPKLLSKTPEVLQVVGSKEIDQLNVSSLDEILDYLTGVNIESGTGSLLPAKILTIQTD